MFFLPVLISIRRWHEQLEPYVERIMEYAIRKAASEIILNDGGCGIAIQFGKGTFICMLWIAGSYDPNQLLLTEKCNSLVSACNKYFNCDVCCYIGEAVAAWEMPQITDKIIKLDSDNVAYENRTFLLKQGNNNPEGLKLPSTELWTLMLSEGSGDLLSSEIARYLENMSYMGLLNSRSLKQFHQDFMQIVYSVLKQRDIHARQLLNDSETLYLYDKAIVSVKNMLEWVEHIIGKMAEQGIENGKAGSVVEKVKKYIRKEIDKDLTREDVANHLFLHADYLDRLFKKETGMSVTKYLLNERLYMAQELLSKTQMPVSKIASSVGLKNISHFYAAFKKNTNMNPADYRNRYALSKK
jgi:two-component system response regulator YesN